MSAHRAKPPKSLRQEFIPVDALTVGGGDQGESSILSPEGIHGLDAQGRVVGKYPPIAGGAPGAGGGETHSTTTVRGIRGWLRTEAPAWLDQQALADIKTKLGKGDRSVFAEPVDVTVVGGKTYVLDGHHRLTAAVDAGYSGRIPVRVIPESELPTRSGINPSDLANGHFGPIGG